MDYAAALRAAPTGPVVRLDTTPVAKQTTQKPVAKPVKVEVEEIAPTTEEEAVPSVVVPSAPAKPPSNAGLSPVVRFVINVPRSGSSGKDAHSAPSDTNADDSDSADEGEEEASGNGVKANKASSSSSSKANNYSVQDLENVRHPYYIPCSTSFHAHTVAIPSLMPRNCKALFLLLLFLSISPLFTLCRFIGLPFCSNTHIFPYFPSISYQLALLTAC